MKRLLWLFPLMFVGLLAALELVGQTIPIPERPHDIAKCDLPARAAKNGAHPCGCPIYVAAVQEAFAEWCWRESGFSPPPFPIPSNMLPAPVAACMRTMPNHCQTIAKGVFFWQDKLKKKFIDIVPPAGGAFSRCATACWPQRCGCADGACASHGETDAY